MNTEKDRNIEGIRLMTARINSDAETTPSLPPKREMSMMTWMATEGGRKCPACGKYAKAEELGPTGGYFNDGQIVVHISSYGHLPGFGCNRSQNTEGLASAAGSDPYLQTK
jgi:hypothetical protein